MVKNHLTFIAVQLCYANDDFLDNAGILSNHSHLSISDQNIIVAMATRHTDQSQDTQSPHAPKMSFLSVEILMYF